MCISQARANVPGIVVPKSGHWIREAQPAYMINHFESFLGI
ncbi:hypothetical protein [Streptomyces sp. NPDC091209]